MKSTAASLLFALVSAGAMVAQQPASPLADYIQSIPAIDNHAHVAAPTLANDTGYDALPCDALQIAPAPPGLPLRFNPAIAATWKALWGVEATSDNEAVIREVVARAAAARQQRGLEFDNWVLEQANVATVLANRVSMAPGLEAPHFLWVPYDDALLFPLNNTLAAGDSPDRHAFFVREEAILKDYLRDSGQTKLPATLRDYLQTVVSPTLLRQKQAGAVAIKFEAAYLRALDFKAAAGDVAAGAYAKYAGGGTPGPAEYKAIQDFVFHYLAAEAGRLGMAVHIHTGAGCGDHFDVRGSNPVLLEAALDDPTLAHTHFVLLHGGFPFDRNMAALITKPNVYVDTSVLGLIHSPQEVAAMIRPWLEAAPEKVLFGTDAGPFGPGLNWAETTWLGTHNTRQALALALSGLVKDGVIGDEQARAIARDVLHDNAARIYGLPKLPANP